MSDNQVPPPQLELLDSRLDTVFWMKLKEDLVDSRRLARTKISDFYLDGFVPAGMDWLAGSMALDLHDDMPLSEFVIRLAMLCDEQKTLALKGQQLALNTLISDLQASESESTVFDRLLAKITGYPILGLFLADVAGSFLLPARTVEPLFPLPEPLGLLRIEIINVVSQMVEVPYTSDTNGIHVVLDKMQWQDTDYLRGGACTLRGGFDVAMQLFQEFRRLYLGGESQEFRSVGCLVKMDSKPMFYAKFPERPTQRNGWARMVGESAIQWDARSPDLEKHLQGQTLVSWVYDRYQERNIEFDLEHALASDLGL